MTKEKEPADAPKGEAKEAVVSAEKQIDVRDEQDRRVIIFASVLILLLTAPVFLSVQDDRSFWRMTRHDDTGRAILIAIFGWPFCVGILGMMRGLQKKAPGKVILGIATVYTSLQTLAGAALITMILLFGQRDERSLPVWLSAVAPLMAIGLVVRSFYRKGWQRWQHLMAPLALLALMIVVCLAGVERRSVEHVSQGGWVFLFATAALVPFIGTTVVSKPR